MIGAVTAHFPAGRQLAVEGMHERCTIDDPAGVNGRKGRLAQCSTATAGLFSNSFAAGARQIT